MHAHARLDVTGGIKRAATQPSPANSETPEILASHSEWGYLCHYVPLLPWCQILCANNAFFCMQSIKVSPMLIACKMEELVTFLGLSSMWMHYSHMFTKADDESRP